MVLAARRRLLGMLLVLATGSAALAFTRLAAWWVVVPPTTMLLTYLSLLREAAKADAERREAARTRTRADATAGGADASRAAPPAAPAAPAAPARAPDAEVIDISASVPSGEEELYDQYTDAKVRAVGDLLTAVGSPMALGGGGGVHGRGGRLRSRVRPGPSGPAGRGTRCWGGR